MSKRKRQFDDDDIEVVEKTPCQDCYRIDWEFAHKDEHGNICKCDRCHALDKKTGEYKPKTLH